MVEPRSVAERHLRAQAARGTGDRRQRHVREPVEDDVAGEDDGGTAAQRLRELDLPDLTASGPQRPLSRSASARAPARASASP